MLKIEFDNPSGEIHIVIRDECSSVSLNPNDKRLDSCQQGCARQGGLKRFLVYENINVFEEFKLEDKRFRIYCPECNTEYFIAEEEYKRLLEEFCLSGKHDYWNGLIKSKS